MCVLTERGYNLWILNKKSFSVRIKLLLTKTENYKINHGVCSVAQGFKIKCVCAIHFVYIIFKLNLTGMNTFSLIQQTNISWEFFVHTTELLLLIKNRLKIFNIIWQWLQIGNLVKKREKEKFLELIVTVQCPLKVVVSVT